jgi:hypothetical protein
MSHELTLGHHGAHTHPVSLSVDPAFTERNRLTCAFRIILAIPHLVLVGGPVALALSFVFPTDADRGMGWGGGGGVLGVVAMVAAMISWFAIVFTGRMPPGLWKLNAFYLRWRVRAAAYVALLRDDYPPFGDGPYPALLDLPRRENARDRWSVGFRILLALPHLVMVWVLGIAWMMTSVFAWFAILLTGRYPRRLYEFAVGVLRWSTNVEAYLLLLHDEFPPFSLSR